MSSYTSFDNRITNPKMPISNAKVSVFLIINQPLLEYAMTQIFKPEKNILIIGSRPSLEHSVDLLLRDKPDVVLMDLDLFNKHITFSSTNLERKKIISKIEEIHCDSPDTKFIFLSSTIEVDFVIKRNELGINGYLLKSDDFSLYLIQALRTVHSGGCCFSKEILDIKNIPSNLTHNEILTKRQVEILETIILQPNLSYENHANHLRISKYTLNSHLRTIFEKLSSNNLTAAVITALRLGIVTILPQNIPDIGMNNKLDLIH